MTGASPLHERLDGTRQDARRLPGPLALAALRRQRADLLAHGATALITETTPDLSARDRFSFDQKRLGMIAVLIIGVSLAWSPLGTLIAINAAFVLFYLAGTGIRAGLLVLTLTDPDRISVKRAPPLPDADLPVVTAICPLYKEQESLPNLVRALAALDYPPAKLDIKLVLEADDRETLAAARRMSEFLDFDLVIVPDAGPRTKPKACNHALWTARGDIVVVYDAEDRPLPDQLRRAAAAFAALPPDVGCLQARLNYHNRADNWITRLFAVEYALIFDLLLPGLARLGAPLPLGGTSNLFRASCLAAVGGWDPHNVTEDADLGMRLAQTGWQTRVLDSTTYEEAMDGARPWLRQRSRWIKGYMQTWAVHARRRGDWRRDLTLHVIIGGVVVSALVNPIFWGLYIAWLLGLGSLDILFPGPLAGLATLALLAGNLFQLWLFMLAPMKRRWHDLVPWALLAPAYWLMQSAAGYIAAYQFVSRPHYWEKTEHGAGPPPLVAMGLAE